ncbi:integrase arm-type DNA-binding domain-containing protein [Glaesserella parasuis]|nr:integrase arm-type DNA-binding domain-containing protein [Glaesserella parasuis]MDO9974747.1 integrase arm-type DNA-binding domain-containing protein [Glaesserella parasuis]MDP0040592.1 integrase arm-type DNA-binding domain-containing protein [Glaesserella parasuis]
MARPTKELHKTTIQNAKPAESDYKLMDGKGLFLLVKKNGSKIWRFRYVRPNTGKQTDLSLGELKNLSLAQARALRDEYRLLISKGIDPQIHRKEQEQAKQLQQENSFFNVCERWFRDIYPLKAHKEETRRKNWERLEKHVFPIIGDLPLEEIKPRLLVSLYSQIGASNTLDKLHRLIKATMDHGIKLGIIESHNCNIAKDDFVAPLAKNHPAIMPDELPELLTAMNNAYLSKKIKPNTLLAFNLTMLTGLRQTELTRLEWRFIDESEQYLIIPAERMKQSRKMKEQPIDHIIPISSQMARLLATIRQRYGYSRYLFPSTESNSGTIGKDTIAKALRENGYEDKQDAHGIRSIFRTYLTSIGVPVVVAELALAHHSIGKEKTQAVYDRWQFMEERKQALQAVGDYCEQCGMMFEIE